MKILTQVPTSTWTYGCAATAAGMLFGYYDRVGYADFMGTNQWKWDYSSFPGTDGEIDSNADGATAFRYSGDGAKTYDPIVGPHTPRYP